MNVFLSEETAAQIAELESYLYNELSAYSWVTAMLLLSWREMIFTTESTPTVSWEEEGILFTFFTSNLGPSFSRLDWTCLQKKHLKKVMSDNFLTLVPAIDTEHPWSVDQQKSKLVNWMRRWQPEIIYLYRLSSLSLLSPWEAELREWRTWTKKGGRSSLQWHQLKIELHLTSHLCLDSGG